MNQDVLSEVTQFFSKYPARDWTKKHTIIHAGDSSKYIYFIVSGSVRQYIIDKRGVEIVVNTYHNPAFFPMSQALNDKPNYYFYEPIDDCVLRAAPHEDVLRFVSNNHKVTMNLLARVLSGMDGVLMRMVYSMSESAYVRVLHELIVQSQRLSEESHNISLPLKEYELGQLCGLARETVSREFNKLKLAKLVDVKQNSIIVYDIERLTAELERCTA